MKFRTIYEGERAIIVNRNGEQKVFTGPKRVFLFMEKLERLTEYVADASEYLEIKYLNGKLVHKQGPAREWFNRFEHQSIRLRSVYKLDDAQLLVVYKRDEKTKEVNRRLVHGPCLFMPADNEWIHQFKWHAADPKNKGHLIHAHRSGSAEEGGAEILTTRPDFLHYFVKDVRTVDDTLITVKLMVNYELNDIIKMLDKTQDPISDFINAICADVISFVAKLTFREFITSSAEKLNDLDTYVQLKQRAETNGYKIDSIIYNGYISSSKLQAMQESAIEARTRMRLNAETEKQRNELINLRLESRNKRFKQEAELQTLKSNFEQKLLGEKSRFEMDMARQAHEASLNLAETAQKAEREVQLREQETEQSHLKELRSVGVDVDEYHLESLRLGSKVDKQYQILN